jgi:hypothetical protein
MTIIEIKQDGKGGWNLVAKDEPEASPTYVALGRNRVQIEFLVRGIMADHEPTEVAR